jgi:hypothetical protein
MKTTVFCLAFLTLVLNTHASDNDTLQWKSLSFPNYQLNYTYQDSSLVINIRNYIERGIAEATGFFGLAFKQSPVIYLFPDRNSLTVQWRKDWNLPSFEAQCWMVASGVAGRLDILSPGKWRTEACEHPGDSTEVRQIVLHELIHSLHAQHNPKPGFEGMEEIDWLVEGIATYASGQLNTERIQRIKRSFAEGRIPVSFKELWTGADKYGKAGSFVSFLDKKFGRIKLTGLLLHTSQESILEYLDSKENDLIKAWIKSLNDGQ